MTRFGLAMPFRERAISKVKGFDKVRSGGMKASALLSMIVWFNAVLLMEPRNETCRSREAVLYFVASRISLRSSQRSERPCEE